MAMRMSGLMSGMDTESLIQQLVEAKSVKVTTAKKAQTKLNWKQDAWKDLNTKLKNLQSKFLSNMRFSTSYTKKVTKVSNPNAVSVITGENAVNGVQELSVKQLAKTAYLTGGEVTTGAGGEAVTALTKISDLKMTDKDGNVTGGMGALATNPGKINITNGSTSLDIDITENTTISDVLTQLKNAGLNASFDAKWGRFSISAKNSGQENDFSITALNQNGADALNAMKLQTSLVSEKDEVTGEELNATLKEYTEYAGYYVAGDRNATAANMKSMIDAEVASRTESYLKQYKSLTASLETTKEAIQKIKDKYQGTNTLNADDDYKYETEIAKRKGDIERLNGELSAADSSLTEDDKKKKAEQVAKLQEEVTDLESLVANNETKKTLEGQITNVKTYVDIQETGKDAEGNVTYSVAETADRKLRTEIENRYYDKAEMAFNIISNPSSYGSKGATKVSGRDAVISLNGAEYTNKNNTFEINGLTFTALAETDPKAPITVTTEQDVDGIYDMVKNFLKEYNAIVNEMDKLYNADAARGYEPLSDEEKEAMSEKDAEKYEQKIKDSLLRRDENLSSISSGLKSIMSSGIDVNGKTMHLFDFGIDTLSYFVAPDNEKNAYHIDGDADDGYTSGNDDKLKTMIANDPDTVITFFTKLSQDLYGKMSDMSKSVDGYRSFGNFYDDKKMKSDYDEYTSKIATLEQKLNDYEDSWYKKFSAMETAMAKMQQNANAVTSLLGGS